jgi:hypothetical protein
MLFLSFQALFPSSKMIRFSPLFFDSCDNTLIGVLIPNTNVVKKWLEFTRAIKRDEVAGRYTERAPKNCTHQQQSIFSYQKVDTNALSKDECSYGQEGLSRGSQHD